jgi:hypothetical protein
MVEFAVLGLQNPAGAKRPDTFSRNGIHIQMGTVIAIHIKPPPSHPPRQALPARYATPSVAATTMDTHTGTVKLVKSEERWQTTYWGTVDVRYS